MPRRYWLMKCEPAAYTIDDLARDGCTSWEGVRNYQARNFMRDQMQEGDGVLFFNYRSDRMRQIVSALGVEGFSAFDTGRRPAVRCATMRIRRSLMRPPLSSLGDLPPIRVRRTAYPSRQIVVSRSRTSLPGPSASDSRAAATGRRKGHRDNRGNDAGQADPR